MNHKKQLKALIVCLSCILFLALHYFYKNTGLIAQFECCLLTFNLSSHFFVMAAVTLWDRGISFADFMYKISYALYGLQLLEVSKFSV